MVWTDSYVQTAMVAGQALIWIANLFAVATASFNLYYNRTGEDVAKPVNAASTVELATVPQASAPAPVVSTGPQRADATAPAMTGATRSLWVAIDIAFGALSRGARGGRAYCRIQADSQNRVCSRFAGSRDFCQHSSAFSTAWGRHLP